MSNSENNNKIVLQKYIASSGMCSRRKAEDWIWEGKVLVNGEVAELGMKVDDNDKIQLNGQIIKPQKDKVYIKLNKPVGYTCTNKSFYEEKTIFDILKETTDKKKKIVLDSILNTVDIINTGLHSVGRLDKDSRGLVLLTNDGELTQKLTHPKYEHRKEYIVTVQRPKKEDYSDEEVEELYKSVVRDLQKGVDIGEGDGVVKVKEVSYLNDNKFKVVLAEGKKRQIRRMFGRLKLRISDLVREHIASLELGNLKEGEWELLDAEEIKKLLK